MQSWDAFFRNATNGAQPGAAYTPPPNLAPYNRNEVPLTSLVPTSGGMPSISAGLFIYILTKNIYYGILNKWKSIGLPEKLLQGLQ